MPYPSNMIECVFKYLSNGEKSVNYCGCKTWELGNNFSMLKIVMFLIGWFLQCTELWLVDSDIVPETGIFEN